MNRQQLRDIMGALDSIIKENRDNHPILNGLTITSGSASFGANDAKISILVCEPIVVQQSDLDGADANIRNGYARPGNRVQCSINNGSIQRGVIVKTNPKKYVIKGFGGKYDGQSFTINHRACSRWVDEPASNATV